MVLVTIYVLHPHFRENKNFTVLKKLMDLAEEQLRALFYPTRSLCRATKGITLLVTIPVLFS